MLGDGSQLESVERLMRKGVYCGPLVLNWVAIGGGADGPNPFTLLDFIRRTPDGAVTTAAKLIAESYRAIEVFVIAGARYRAINYTLTRMMAALEHHLTPYLRERPKIAAGEPS